MINETLIYAQTSHDHLARPPGAQLFGVEQQILSIGRALMTHPDLIILGEATESLAPLVVAEI